MEIKYDVFIAYHGTYENSGSNLYASKIADYLLKKGLKVFFYPYSTKDAYKTNIFEVINSRTIIFVTNEQVHRTQNKKIDHKNHYELNVELDAFYSMTFLEGELKRSSLDSKVVFCGEYNDEFIKGDESLLHELFKDRVHFEFNKNNPEASFEEIYNWVISRSNTKSNYLASRLSKEVDKVYSKRTALIDGERFAEKVYDAKKIIALGISNSDLTTRVDESALYDFLDNGGEMELYFLDPDGQHTLIREIEEQYEDHRIKKTTETNLNAALSFRSSLPDELKDRYHIYFYDISPRLNIIFVDENLYLQFYGYISRGMDTPSFAIKKQEGKSPIYEYCMKSYNYIKTKSKEIDYGKRY